MENTRLCSRSQSKHATIPEELHLELLMRLPVKTLLRFRSVSKPWRSMIDDPRFCYLHFNAFKNNTSRDRLLIVQGSIKSPPVDGLIVCSETFETLETSFSFPEGCNSWVVRLTYDGLVLLKDSHRRNDHWLMLWNPSIKKCRKIPTLQGYMCVGKRYYVMGLGFDPSTKDYKVAVLSLNNRERPVAVYSVGKKSWETWPFRVRGGNSSGVRFELNRDVIEIFEGGAELSCFEGRFYFILNKKQLGSYNLGTNAFSFNDLPPPLVSATSSLFVGAVDGGCSVALFQVPCRPGETSAVWVPSGSSHQEGDSDNASVSWAKRYTFKCDGIQIIDLTSPSPKNSEGDIVFGFTKTGLVAYNVKTGDEKILPQTLGPNYTECVALYKESLVLLHG